MNPVNIIIYTLSFFSLYLSIFWISILYLEQDKLKEKLKPVKKYPKVSIIVPMHNQSHIAKKVLTAILNLDYPRNKLEVIAVNDASTDDTQKIIEAIRSKRLKIINRYPGYTGKAAAVNQGIEHATGDFIGVIDGDNPHIERDALKLMIPHFDENTGAVIGSIKVWKPKTILEKVQWFEYLFVTVMRKLMATLNALHVTPGGAFSLYRKEVFSKIGSFDEKTLTEDLEMAMRLQYHGYKIKQELDSINYTEVPNKLKWFHTQRVRWYRGWLETVYKYRDMVLNKKFGFLGMFQIPVSIIVPLLLVIITTIILVNLVKLVVNFYKLFVNGIIPSFNIVQFVATNLVYLSFTGVLLLGGIYILAKSQKFLNEPWKYPLIIPIYFTVYQMLLSSYWLIAVGYELFRLEKKW